MFAFALTGLCAATLWAKPAGPVPERCRVVVRVAATDIGTRLRDERPAEFRLAADGFAAGRRLDLGSLQVVRWNPRAAVAMSEDQPYCLLRRRVSSLGKTI